MALYSNLPSLSLLPSSLWKKRNFANSFQRNSLIFARTHSNFWNIYKATLTLLNSIKRKRGRERERRKTMVAFSPPNGGEGGGGIERRGSVATGSRNFSWLAWFIACKSVNKSKPCVAGLRVCRCAPWGRSQLIKNPKIIDRVMDILCTRAAHFASHVRLIFTSAVGYRLFVVRENYPVNRGIITRKKRGMMVYGYGV